MRPLLAGLPVNCSNCSYDFFITRILQAALDHNFHLFCKKLRDSEEELQYKTTYSKRSKCWWVEQVKEPKK